MVLLLLPDEFIHSGCRAPPLRARIPGLFRIHLATVSRNLRRNEERRISRSKKPEFM